MIQELIERLEKLTGPDRGVDWLIAELFGEIPEHRIIDVGWDYDWYRHTGDFTLWRATDSEGRSVEHWSPKPVTNSVDAALNFLKEQLPDWHVENLCQWESTVVRARGEWMCDLVSVQKPGEARQHVKCAHAVNPAIALTVAILKAKAAQS
jgi:hypothetical protein